MTVTPMLPFLDQDFLAYAGMPILTRTIAFGVIILLGLRIVDMASDSRTMPGAGHVALRVVAAFLVPLFVFTAMEWGGSLPADWRRHYDGEYAIGQDMPAGSWSLTARKPGATVTLRRSSGGTDEMMSYSWDAGNVCVTVEDGDEMEISGAVARNRTVSLAYNPNASTGVTVEGTAFLVAGADIMPGTYELHSIADPEWEAQGVPASEYEVRDGYLSVDEGIHPTGYEGTAYVDVHYGQVLYARWTQIDLYSTVFAPARDDGDAGDTGDEEGNEAKGEPRDGDANADANADARGGKTDESASPAEGGKADAGGPAQGDPASDAGADEPQDGDGKGGVNIHDLIMRAAKDAEAQGA